MTRINKVQSLVIGVILPWILLHSEARASVDGSAPQEVIEESFVRMEQTIATRQLDVPFLTEPGLLNSQQFEALKRDIHASVQDNFDFVNTNRPIIKEQSYDDEAYIVGTAILDQLYQVNRHLLNFLRFFNYFDINEIQEGDMGKSILMGAILSDSKIENFSEHTNLSKKQKERILLHQVAPAIAAEQMAISAVNFAEIAYRFTERSSQDVCNDLKKEFNANRNTIHTFHTNGKNFSRATNKEELSNQICGIVNASYLQLEERGEERWLSSKQGILDLKEKVAELYFNLNHSFPNIQGTVRLYHPPSETIYELDEEVPEDIDGLVKVLQLDEGAYELYGNEMYRSIENVRGAFGMLVAQLGIAPTQLMPGIEPVGQGEELIPLVRPYKKFFQHVKNENGEEIANRKHLKPLDFARRRGQYRKAIKTIYNETKTKLGYFYKLNLDMEISPFPDADHLNPMQSAWQWVDDYLLSTSLNEIELQQMQRMLKGQVDSLRHGFVVDTIRLTPFMLGSVLVENPELMSVVPKFVNLAERKQKRLNTTTKILEIIGVSTVGANWGMTVAGVFLKRAARKLIINSAFIASTGGLGSVATGASLAGKTILQSMVRIMATKRNLVTTAFISNSAWATATFAKSILYKDHYRSMLHSIAMGESMPDNNFTMYSKSFRRDRNWAIASGFLNAFQVIHILKMFQTIDRASKFIENMKMMPSLLKGPMVNVTSAHGLTVLKGAFQNTQNALVGSSQLETLATISPIMSASAITTTMAPTVVATAHTVTHPVTREGFTKTIHLFDAILKTTGNMEAVQKETYLSKVINRLKTSSPESLRDLYQSLKKNECW